jgi:carotenoid 1,2-hydratase
MTEPSSALGMPSPAFDVAVAPNGYVWWYLDALGDDGLHGLTIIAFIGSVFSPYYARARGSANGAGADPANHCAFNVALYGRAGHRWAMTERGHAGLQRTASRLQIGPSSLAWDGDTLTLQIDEVTVPWPSRLRGVVRLKAERLLNQSYALDPAGRHQWGPIATQARVEVEMERPALRWHGEAYFDSNRGSRPLEDDFVRWDWSRASLSGTESVVLYDVVRRAAPPVTLALRFDGQGQAHPLAVPPRVALPRGAWGVARATLSDPDGPAVIEQTLEDSPFYVRSLLRSRLAGQDVRSVHESLDLDRFKAKWVRTLLPFRMPRVRK